MGTPQEPKPAKYFAAFLTSDVALLPSVEDDLGAILGAIDGRSELIAWTASKYYEREMGSNLLRGFFSFAALRSPAELAALKLATQRIEQRFRYQDGNGRRVNLDPGYLDSFKVVLASTKNASQRIYLDRGIYAEATLFYHSGEFHGLPYTYADYLWPETLAFLTRLRAIYLEQLRQVS
ncbi:MAG TPA: DUF4416 family protein [Candidatus Limnocylindrales bacterium]|nr:DUF4416 family protein [Candidatus Limnocylindrales bacterium]